MDFPAMIASMTVTNPRNWLDELRVRTQYSSFVFGELRDTYLVNLSPVYYTSYENLALNGSLKHNGKSRRFFLFSGIHDKDFPWGDRTAFWDIAILIQEGNSWRRYVLSNHRIKNLKLDIEKGTCTYEGEMFEITRGTRASFKQMRQAKLPDHLRKVKAKIRLKFKAKQFRTQDMPFAVISNYKKHIDRKYMAEIKKLLPHFDTLGFHLTPHKVTIDEGTIIIKDGHKETAFTIDKNSTLGEAEVSSFHNVREPSLYYNYFCAIDPSQDTLRLHIRSNVLRKNRKEIVIDKIDEQLGRIVDHISSLDLKIKGNRCNLLSREDGESFPDSEQILLEINNDHYPTAVFQRRIVELKGEHGKGLLALEENMDLLNLGSINSDRIAKVVAVKDPDKFLAMDKVIEKTGFFDTLNTSRKRSGKDKNEFSVIIKPNFMFMYSLKDPSTYTDPELVEHLVSRIYKEGYRKIAVADARSTYGTFFTNREVESVARYIGLDGSGPGGEHYKIIDLSLGLEEHNFSGKLKKHPVNKDWKEADFRISFAKNKTHCYAYYTLTLKNIYGALPKENKFKEYHCERDIFSTTIEFLKKFPVQFGFIDAYISADGPFGIFADKDPNHTETIIGGADLVAVDWVGAAKMGLDPEVSEYMSRAVKAFGKPDINLLGDRTLYPDWVNVSEVVSRIAFDGLDREYYFGNFFYSIFSTMDPYFEYKEKSTVRRIVRILDDPIRSLFFERVEQGVIDRALSNKLHKMLTGS
jgi:uncharacterized protein (DUF362 family)